MKHAALHTDGGARGNPGPAAIGYVLRVDDKRTIFHGERVGETTNNQAEYLALREGLQRALDAGVTAIECFLDSELVVKQLQGHYRVKHIELKPRFKEVESLASRFEKITFTHVPRAKNKEADALVNEALDIKRKK